MLKEKNYLGWSLQFNDVTSDINNPRIKLSFTSCIVNKKIKNADKKFKKPGTIINMLIDSTTASVTSAKSIYQLITGLFWISGGKPKRRFRKRPTSCISESTMRPVTFPASLPLPVLTKELTVKKERWKINRRILKGGEKKNRILNQKTRSTMNK